MLLSVFKKFKKTISIGIVVCLLSTNSSACVPTTGGMPQIAVSLCHTCMFPMSIGGIQIAQGPMPDPNSTIASPVCVCLDPFPRVGIPIAFFEPSRLIEIVSDPYCFPTLGFGLTTSAGLLGGSKQSGGTSSKRTFMQAHYMIFPVYALLEIVTDIGCLDNSLTDVAYITEPDPLWNSDTLSAFIQPEALLFGNPVTNLVCVADSIASSVFMPLNPLFWCMGSWGNVYPLTGSQPTKDSFVADTSGIAAKLIYKLHRELILWGSVGTAGLCGHFPMPIWMKSAYRLQIMSPIPHPIGHVIGQSGLLWDTTKNTPTTMDNFGYVLFKKRDCCVL